MIVLESPFTIRDEGRIHLMLCLCDIGVSREKCISVFIFLSLLTSWNQRNFYYSNHVE